LPVPTLPIRSSGDSALRPVKKIRPGKGDRSNVELVTADHRERLLTVRAEAQPGSCRALGDVAAGRAELTRRSPVDDQPGSLVSPTGNHRLPREFEQVRLDGRKVSDSDRHRLETPASARIGGLAGNAMDLGGQSHLVHGVEYPRDGAGPA
jgi:hypothetical protein